MAQIDTNSNPNPARDDEQAKAEARVGAAMKEQEALFAEAADVFRRTLHATYASERNLNRLGDIKRLFQYWAALRFSAHEADICVYLDACAQGRPILFRLDERPGVWLLDGPARDIPSRFAEGHDRDGAPVRLQFRDRVAVPLVWSDGAELVATLAEGGSRPLVVEVNLNEWSVWGGNPDRFEAIEQHWMYLLPEGREAARRLLTEASRLVGAEVGDKGIVDDFRLAWLAFGDQEQGWLRGAIATLANLAPEPLTADR